nr:PKD domain-containing protein [uncultured Psychroserpens sp.]
MKRILLFVFSIISFQNYAQDVNMQNGTITTCSGVFFDSGGEFANYSDNENLVFTICPESLGQRTRLDFFEFSTQLGIDTMIIYDGDSMTSDVIGVFSGNVSPGLIVASFDNPTGCLTIEFLSNETGNTLGWAAAITCTTPCQDITSQLDSTNPTPNGEGIIEVCTGDNIILNGSGVFEVDGTGASYTWDLGDGNSASGQNVTISYDLPGVYLVDLHIRDTNTDNFGQGCPDNNTINQVIRVSGEPDFTGTQADDATLCFGESTTIEGVVTPLTLVYNCPPPESEETFLPDGSGAAYSTCIDVTCFAPDAILTDISQLSDICINIEHSYSGDLDIKIISPNGQEANLFVQGGAGIYFGGANDDNTNDPGIGADYCFSMSASSLLLDANTIIAGTNPPSPSWEPGSYLPVDSFQTLVGSPLNGEWCIEIVDNLSIDNGYIFSWELNFDPSVPQEDFDFIPNITSESWDSDPSIIETNENVITVEPSGSGEFCYTYRIVDVFGCEYTKDVCIDVADEDQPPVTYYEDTDGDGYGDPNSTVIECSDEPPVGYVANSLDCNDGDESINPDAIDNEGNGIDENCDGVDGDLLSVEDITANIIKVLPNPFDDKISINLPAILNSNVLNINIYDINGRVIYSEVHSNLEGVIVINRIGELANGSYFLNISNENLGLSVIKKLIKL